MATLLGPASPAAAASYAPIAGGGSTMTYNAFHTWISNVFQYGLRVDYERSGNTTGRTRFREGTLDWASTDLPYGLGGTDLPPERGYAYMPDIAVATGFMYNLTIGGERVDNLRLSGDNIAKIFTGTLTMWNDPALLADNPGLALPAIPIVPVVRTDGSGSTWQFTQWLAARHAPQWTAYCAATGVNPCGTPTAYPVLAGSAMVGQPGDLGVPGYVTQAGANGAIGYVESPQVTASNFPVAKVLNSAGYYTSPTPGHIGLSLLKAKVSTTNGLGDLSDVYTNPDPRTYELSSFSYMVLPTDNAFTFNASKGYTLGDFGRYLLCAGQSQVTGQGYAPLPLNLLRASYGQLQKVPGAQLPATADFSLCHNPAVAADGTDALSATDPMPRPCDRLGAALCPAVVATATTLTGPAEAREDTPVTLTATVTPADAVGTVEFITAMGSLGPPVPLVNGVAQLTRYPIDNLYIYAKFTPTDEIAYAPSMSSGIIMTVTVQQQDEKIQVDVPLTEGVFTMTVDNTPVQMSEATLRPDHTFESSGDLRAVTVSDERDQTHPGWTVTGQVSDFTDGVHTFSGGYLGWTPIILAQNANHDVTTAAPVSPGAGPGLKDGAGLASAASPGGLGTTMLGAELHLKIPSTTQPGLYSATLTITGMAHG
ncbi:substrate-binding domain-containing protein [Dactylosporangium sp. McL0621]|uniref:substrate-binding domain-containing protein n=1 Tax=Dactylosporangium sp. McL0621 TaxID=3415678 RepID=UPI003CE8F6D0